MWGEIQHWKWHPLTPTEFQITNFRIVEQTFDKGAEWPEHSVNSENYQGNNFCQKTKPWKLTYFYELTLENCQLKANGSTYWITSMCFKKDLNPC